MHLAIDQIDCFSAFFNLLSHLSEKLVPAQRIFLLLFRQGSPQLLHLTGRSLRTSDNQILHCPDLLQLLSSISSQAHVYRRLELIKSPLHFVELDFVLDHFSKLALEVDELLLLDCLA